MIVSIGLWLVYLAFTKTSWTESRAFFLPFVIGSVMPDYLLLGISLIVLKSIDINTFVPFPEEVFWFSHSLWSFPASAGLGLIILMILKHDIKKSILPCLIGTMSGVVLHLAMDSIGF